MDEKEERNSPEARIERIVWPEGDIRIIRDPREDRARKAGGNPNDEDQAELDERDRLGDA